MSPTGVVVFRRRRLLVLAICSLALFMTYLDTSALNVALPTIARDFHARVSGLQWVLDAYQLVLASLLILAGSAADRVGRRKVFRIGLVTFSLASLLCSLAPSGGLLVAFRVFQATGGCMLVPASLSTVRQVFTDPAERAQALGLWNAVFGLGMACGPLVGGVLVAQLGWRSVFWINVPVGLGAWVLAGVFLPESRTDQPRRVDLPGQLLVMAVLALLTFGLIEGPVRGWGSAAIVGAFGFSFGALVALLIVEHRRVEPLLELGFFRSPIFSAAAVIAVLVYLDLAGFLLINTLYLQQVRGDSPMVVGIAVLPVTAMIIVFAPISGRLVANYGARLPLVLAGSFVAAGSTMLLLLTPTTPYWFLAVAYVLLGVGFGLVNPPISNSAVTGMPVSRAGVAGAVASTSRQVGNTLGVAIMGSMVASSVAGSAGFTASAGAQFTHQTHHAWALATGCGLLIIAVALACTGPRARRRAALIYRDV